MQKKISKKGRSRQPSLTAGMYEKEFVTAPTHLRLSTGKSADGLFHEGGNQSSVRRVQSNDSAGRVLSSLRKENSCPSAKKAVTFLTVLSITGECEKNM